MNFGDMFAMMGPAVDPYDNQFSSPQSSFPSFPTTSPDNAYQPMEPMSWEEAFNGFKTRPVLYNMDGWISPYASNNWGGTSNILAYIDEQYKLPMGDAKIDPNKIFTAEVNGLRALSADQAKILKMFEKKLAESLSEKGKVGLTEEDIEAMAAITSARSALTNIEKEKVAIKKNIADIKIKQAQNNNNNSGGGNNAAAGKPVSSMDIGRNILDGIFASPGMSSMNPIPNIPTTEVEYSGASAGYAESVLDSLVSDKDINPMLSHENSRIVAIVGDTDSDVSFIAVDKDGIEDSSYPQDRIPQPSDVANVDRLGKKVELKLGQSIDIDDSISGVSYDG